MIFYDVPDPQDKSQEDNPDKSKNANGNTDENSGEIPNDFSSDSEQSTSSNGGGGGGCFIHHVSNLK